MIKFGRTAQSAISAMSFLAEQPAGARVSSLEIAEARSLSRPLAAKLLTVLSQGGLVAGTPGPGGGYALAKPASEICLKDIVEQFELPGELICPFGPGWCGVRDPCPLHDQLAELNRRACDFLETTHLGVFAMGEE